MSHQLSAALGNAASDVQVRATIAAQIAAEAHQLWQAVRIERLRLHWQDLNYDPAFNPLEYNAQCALQRDLENLAALANQKAKELRSEAAYARIAYMAALKRDNERRAEQN